MSRSIDEFTEVYDEHVWDVYGFFGYRVSSREAAEDLTQATFERALKAWRRFDPERASARTWLLAIAHNLLVDHYRSEGSRRHESLPEGEMGDAVRGSEPDPAPMGVAPDLERALNDLGDREREIVALRFGGDLSGPEIAEITGLTLANVQQILSRTLRRLRARLQQEEQSPARADPS